MTVASRSVRFQYITRPLFFKQVSAFISLPAAIGALIGIEFALDRSSLEHYILYAVMLAVLAVHVTLGVLLLRKREKEAA